MKLWSGLAWRTTVASLLLGVLATLAASYFSVRKVVAESTRFSARFFTEAMLMTHGEACRAAPGGWTYTSPTGLTVVAFDAARVLGSPGAGTSGAGPDPALVARMAQGEQEPVSLHFPLFDGSAWGGKLLTRVAAAGPCSLLEYRWPRMTNRLSELRWMLLAAVAFTALASALSMAAVITPLLRRLRRLHGAAGGLGSPGYASPADTIADELGDLSRGLDATHARVLSDAARIEAQKHALERFLSNVAHDLKTPIASLQLALELATTAPSQALPELLVRGIEDTVYLTALVDNLRLACQLGEDVDPLEGEPRAELGMIVERVVRRLGLLARRKALSVESSHPDAELWVRCHPTMLEQAVGNLVHNAITHGDPGGHVVALLEPVGTERFRLTVLDDGPGLPPEGLGRLGERLFRAPEARHRDPRGSGLGVAIVRELCRRAGLTLTFSANAPRGLQVIIEGPRAAPPAEAMAARAAGCPPPLPRTTG
ncbi:sensor histidine kinase [Corallococcus praedator]|uniref:histidine kinase n=1 Tax=Corallococcus praedator TaxID=2316724 RepID=A0ABX9QJU8_9BACT|nr:MULTISPECIES: HAMP domain-containing sensor histidine kinase [Corallococcus]RKH15948.1 sensor histidine kinase [Corallococcus sp. CA047B]RKH30241.1 sensor histidine kinase [Corallococcus sp. CA031C]RKI09885.1 sensor histidine kinase [Corallococcus praedator]